MGGEQQKGKEGVIQGKDLKNIIKKRDFMTRGMGEKMISRMKLSN